MSDGNGDGNGSDCECGGIRYCWWRECGSGGMGDHDWGGTVVKSGGSGLLVVVVDRVEPDGVSCENLSPAGEDC